MHTLASHVNYFPRYHSRDYPPSGPDLAGAVAGQMPTASSAGGRTQSTAVVGSFANPIVVQGGQAAQGYPFNLRPI